MPRPCAHREPGQRRIVDAIGIRKRPFLAERDRDHRPSLARGVVQGPTSKLTRPVVGGVSVRTEEALGALGGPATDRGDEEVRLNRGKERHQGTRGLHEVGGGVPGVSRRVCTEAGLGSGCGVRRGRRIDGSVGRGRAEREADASTNQRRRGGSQIVPSGSGGIRGGHAASHPLRQQGGCVEARSEVRRGRLVRAAGRRPVRLSGAGRVAVIRNAAGVPLAVATIPSGTGGARARAREAWSGGKTACGGGDARRGCEGERPARRARLLSGH